MAKNFTAEQLSAINTIDKTLLVSAAAGAGKTSTLTERIVRSITRDNNPDDISKMLIVTFTNAATEQLRGDIREAIERELEKNPENTALTKQLDLLPMANISTIDAFCNDILRKNSDKVGIPPNYRIADRAEVQILSFSILSKLILDFHENKYPGIMTSDEFRYLTDTLTPAKSDAGLEEIFLMLYEKSKSSIPGVKIFEILANEYDGLNPDDNKFTRHAVSLFKNAALYCESVLTEFANELSLSSDDHDVKCSKDFYKNAEIFHRFSLIDDYFTVQSTLNTLKYENITSIKKGREKSPILTYASDIFNNTLKKEIVTIRESYFSYSRDQLVNLFSEFHRLFTLLSKFLVKFDELYMQEKLKRLALEFSDIERFAFRSLYAENDETLTDFALSLKQEHSSIYIDEYQDVNALQSKIFDAVSREDNRFMVGDIKQSIYGFRSADPDVFASMKRSFPKLSSDVSSSAFSIFMSQNFRSEKHIIDFVNSVFDKAFGFTKESIEYLPEDNLVFPENKGITPGKKAFVCLIPERKEDEEEEKKQYVSDDEEESEKEEKITQADELACKYVAKKISELHSDKKLGLDYKDFAIIIRKNRRMGEYAKALAELGIESKSIGDKNFFLNSEVQLALCLLNTIDNPEKDIYLAGLLVSPLFNFTPDELLNISKSKKSSLYKSLVSYTEDNSFPKGRNFLEKLEFYRTIAEGLNIDALLLRLYNDTGLLDLAKRSGGEDNLLLLYDYAKNFSSSSLRGLYNFIKFINNVIDRNAEFDSRHAADENDAVNIISVHASKGLQYKVVFYVETNSSLSSKDSSNRVIYSEKSGISTCLRSQDGLVLVKNPIHSVLNNQQKRRFIEEEFRVIYVALTRAVSELYVVGKVQSDFEQYLEDIDFKTRNLNEYSIYKTKSALDLIMMTAKDRKTFIIEDIDKETLLEERKKEEGVSENEKLGAIEASEAEKNADTNDGNGKVKVPDVFTVSKETLGERISFSYENAHLTKIPEKISVSVLKPRMLDAEDETDAETAKLKGRAESLQNERKKHRIKPSFVEENNSEKSAKRGIASHNFLQFFDVDNFDKNGTENELLRLVNQGFISKDNSELVEKTEIEKFRKSELFREMKSAKKVYREFRFNTCLPARYFNFEKEILEKITDEEILVQGVMDCILEDGNGELHLVDYKTDRLTKEDLADICIASKKLNAAHAAQLSCYALAIEKIFGKKPKTVRVYSLPLGNTVDIKLLDFDKI